MEKYKNLPNFPCFFQEMFPKQGHRKRTQFSVSMSAASNSDQGLGPLRNKLKCSGALAVCENSSRK